MRLKLRPDARLAPVARGLYCSHGDESFVLAGPSALYEALDAHLEALCLGTDVDAFVAAYGEASRPMWQQVLGTLVARGVLLDLDALSEGPPPAPITAQFGDVLAWLETVDDDPYAGFARLQVATVAILGDGPAAAALHRSLNRYGVGTVLTGTGPVAADLVVSVDSPAPDGALVVRTAADHALVGPGGPVMDALARRIAAAVAADPTLVAPAPLSSALAGSLAGHVALQRLVGRVDAAEATVVYGRGINTATIVLPGAAPASTSSIVQLDALTEPEHVPDPAESQRLASGIAARWTGLARWGSDLDLPQLPFSLVTAAGVDAGVVTGYGLNRAAASVNAALGVLRAEHGAAGTTPTRWLVDGELRRLTLPTLADVPATELSWEQVGNADTRSVWNLLHEYFGQRVTAHAYSPPGLTWRLVTVVDAGTGELVAAQWGASVEHAARLALVAAAASVQLNTVFPGTTKTLDLVGTAALETCSGRAVRVAATELGAVTGRRTSWDPLLGASELSWGPTWS